jgi:thiol-disulfide isomerase/thioredoxin
MKKYKKAGILLVLSCLPMIGFAQNGVQFEQTLNWQEVQAKAKKEKKFIFVDCYATWCGPCKLMDKTVYLDDSVADFINARFISVKVQMDTSNSDGPRAKAWYAAAHALGQAYQVHAYPTFLFFSPEGVAVHAGVGYSGVQDFIALSGEALNPKRQYFALLSRYKEGHREFSDMPYLARTGYLLKDNETAREIGTDYIRHYLLHLDSNQLFTKENISFIRDFTRSTKDDGFRFLYLQAAKVDRTMADSTYAQTLLDYLISKDEIDPRVLQAGKDSLASPDWALIRSAITQKYGDIYADRTISRAEVRWYGYKRNWHEFTRSIVYLLEKYGTSMNHADLDENAWSLFRFSNDSTELNVAVAWMAQVVKTESDSTNLLPASLDTYANLLYKCGTRKQEAIETEERALNMAIEFKVQNFEEEFRGTLDKMERGQPTWPITK